jgi:hypothetical protein
MMSPTTVSFSTLAVVLSPRPVRTGALFYAGALAANLAVGVAGAFLIGNAAADAQPNTPKTPVAVIDVVAAVLIVGYVVRLARRPADPERERRMIERMRKVAYSPAIAIVAAGATLANAGAFIPLALKAISETDPSTAGFLLEWLAFTIVAVLPLAVALVALAIAREPTRRWLGRARSWLERILRTVTLVLLLLLAALLLRNGIVGLMA